MVLSSASEYLWQPNQVVFSVLWSGLCFETLAITLHVAYGCGTCKRGNNGLLWPDHALERHIRRSIPRGIGHAKERFPTRTNTINITLEGSASPGPAYMATSPSLASMPTNQWETRDARIAPDATVV